MEYWNADGSVAEMCGNGLRCVAWFAHARGWVGESFVVDTPRGPLPATIVGRSRVRVGVGPVEVGEREVLLGVEATRVDVGNPHAVIEVDDVAAAEVDPIGRRLDAGVPGGINTGFMAASDGAITLRVHERGVGETLACGSGAVAAAAVVLRGDGTVDVHLPGGTLTVEVIDGRAWLTGPVAEVFTGQTP
jgi:diaminopimelate epimerase